MAADTEKPKFAVFDIAGGVEMLFGDGYGIVAFSTMNEVIAALKSDRVQYANASEDYANFRPALRVPPFLRRFPLSILPARCVPTP